MIFMIMVKKEYLQMTEGILIHLRYMPWREEGHAGQSKLQSSISLASGQNSEYISESSIMLGTKSNLSNLYHKKCTATLSTHEATQPCREALNVDVTQVYSNVSNPE